MSKEIENKVDELLQAYGVPFSAQYAGEVTKTDWGIDGKGQRVDAWRVSIGVGPVGIDYFTGLGRRKGSGAVAPSAADVLYSMLADAEAASMTFDVWCDEFGYNSDSIKASSTYKACVEMAEMLKGFTLDQIAELREALQDY
jgi:hypothetical protein